MNSKLLVLPLAATLALTGCVNSKDLAKTLRYADQRAISVGNFPFADLQKLHKGEACTVNFLNWLPLFGDGSLITAVERGKVNHIHYIGETGFWYFPFSTNCTVVYGSDEPMQKTALPAIASPQSRASGHGAPESAPAPAKEAGSQQVPTRRREFW